MNAQAGSRDLVRVRMARPGDVAEICELVCEVFAAFVAADFGPRGRETFYRHTTADDLARALDKGDLVLVAVDRDRIVGVPRIRGSTHVHWLFVQGEWHRKGIATRLLQEALKRISAETPEAGTVTLKSSPFALEAHRRLGFRETGSREARDGILATPMARLIRD